MDRTLVYFYGVPYVFYKKKIVKQGIIEAIFMS